MSVGVKSSNRERFLKGPGGRVEVRNIRLKILGFLLPANNTPHSVDSPHSNSSTWRFRGVAAGMANLSSSLNDCCDWSELWTVLSSVPNGTVKRWILALQIVFAFISGTPNSPLLFRKEH